MNSVGKVQGWVRRLGIRDWLILFLLAAVAASLWRADAIAKERETLAVQLVEERKAHALTRLSLNATEYRAASRELATEVRGDIIDERVAEQIRRADQLEREVAALRSESGGSGCVTPKSIRDSSGL